MGDVEPAARAEKMVHTICRHMRKLERLPVWDPVRLFVIVGEWPLGDDGSTWTVTEDSAWAEVDALVVKALKALRKAGVEHPLVVLTHAAGDVSDDKRTPEHSLLACRLLESAVKADAYPRVVAAARGETVTLYPHEKIWGAPEIVAPILRGDLIRRGLIVPREPV